MSEQGIKYYSVQEVADMLGIYYRTVYGWIKNKEIKAVKIAGQWRISEEDIITYINEQEKNT